MARTKKTAQRTTRTRKTSELLEIEKLTGEELASTVAAAEMLGADIAAFAAIARLAERRQAAEEPIEDLNWPALALLAREMEKHAETCLWGLLMFDLQDCQQRLRGGRQ